MTTPRSEETLSPEGLLSMLTAFKQQSSAQEQLDKLKAGHDPRNLRRASMHGGSDEWRQQRAFKAKLGERLRIKYNTGAQVLTQSVIHQWFEVPATKRIGKKLFEAGICKLGFTNNDAADIAAVFDSMKRGQDKHVSEEACYKMLKRLKQAAEASQQEVRDVSKIEGVLSKKIQELDLLEEQIRDYCVTIGTGASGVAVW